MFGTQLGSAEGPCLRVLGSWPQLLPGMLVKNTGNGETERQKRQDSEKMANPWSLCPRWLNTLVSDEPSPRLAKKHREGSEPGPAGDNTDGFKRMGGKYCE